jgi:hypothetical protein
LTCLDPVLFSSFSILGSEWPFPYSGLADLAFEDGDNTFLWNVYHTTLHHILENCILISTDMRTSTLIQWINFTVWSWYCLNKIIFLLLEIQETTTLKIHFEHISWFLSILYIKCMKQTRPYISYQNLFNWIQ